MKSKTVWIVEGEKDCNTLHDYDIVGTCNSGGAGKWKDGYSQYFKGKEVIICPDNDDPGRKHADQVRESIAPYAKWVKQVRVPDSHKDITSYLSDGGKIEDLLDVPKLYKGIELPIYSMVEVERRYRDLATKGDEGMFNLSKWLPGFKDSGRLYPGDLAVVIGATGAGKSAVMQCIAQKARPMNVLYFQMELTERQMIGRQKGIVQGKAESVIWHQYKSGEYTSPDNIDHIYLSTVSTLTTKQLYGYITNSELIIGKKPDIVMVDYMQLMTAQGGSRYERFSNIAEELKRVAKASNTILIVASQTQRPSNGGDTVIGLHSAKESGSIENSATLVFGVEKANADPTTVTIVIAKYTRGMAGREIECNFNGTLNITEKERTWRSSTEN